MSAPRVAALLVGRAEPFRGAVKSAIAKRPVTGPLHLGPLGFAGDEQADPRFHGGPDKALLLYATAHYPRWREEIGDHPLLDAPGAFGENLAVDGLDEGGVCLGDRYRVGGALIEVSHGRQPCWKIGHRFGDPSVTARVVRNGRGGWYARVIEQGDVALGDALELTARPCPEWTVERLFTLLIAGGHRTAQGELAELADHSLLAEAWRERARELAG